jgi:hypothetical protein
MTPRARQTFPTVTLANMRSHGCRDLLVYCTSPWCDHSATLNADWLPDDTALLDLGHRMVCSRSGLIGADTRPNWTAMSGSGGMGGAHSLSSSMPHRRRRRAGRQAWRLASGKPLA